MTLTGRDISTKADQRLSIPELRQRFAQSIQQQADSITDEQLIEAVLRDESSVEDCTILMRESSVTGHERVAYVVLSEPFSEERLQSYLKTVLPGELLPTAYVPVSHLPLTTTGAPDLAALVQLPVVDQDLAQRWETKLQSIEAVDRAAVVVQETSLKSSLLHLSTLLPDWKSAPAIAPDTTEHIAAAAAETDEQHLSQVPALSFGGPLPDEADAPKTLPAVLQQAAQKNLGDRIVYLQPDGTVLHQSYAGLLEEAEKILAGLRQQGLKPQDKVIFQLERNQDIIAAFWGCILGGFIPVIMAPAPSYQDANSGVEKLCNVWKLLDQPLILTTATLQPAVAHLSQWLPADALTISAIETLRTHSPDTAHHPCQPDDVVFFNLTSGSTGMPKCISLTHWNLISRARGTNILCRHSESDIILNWLPFDHIGSISDWHVRCVYLGCQLIYASKEYILGRPLNWMDLLNQYRITHSWAPNFAYALVNDALKQETQQTWDLSCVKSLLTAGEAVSSKAVEDFIENLAAYGFPKTAVRPAFGMAEMGSGITYYQPTEAQPLLRHIVDKASLKGAIKRVSSDHPNCSTFTDLGPVIPGVSIRIVDSDNNLVNEDTIGCLHVKGDPVSPGYYKNPAVNQEVFLPDGWFNTGDLGFISNGHLVVSGRAKETIIINGANYYNHEIEAVVEEIEGVEVSFTAACAVREPGAATEKLAVFFNTPVADSDRLTELLKHIRQIVVAKIGLNPDYLIPVAQETIPKTAIGKIQRSQLSKQFEAGEFDSILQTVDLLLGNANTLPDWFYRKIWRPKLATPGTVQVRTGQTLVFLDAEGVGETLCATLQHQGESCVGVVAGSEFSQLQRDRYQIDPANPDHYHNLLSAIAQDAQPICQIIHLWTVDRAGCEITSSQALDQTLNQGIYSVLLLIKALEAGQRSEQPVRLLVAATASQATHATEAVMPAKTLVAGLLKSASQEMSWLDCCHLDLPGLERDENATVILQELQMSQSDREVAYRSGDRLVPRLEKVDWQHQPSQPMPLKMGGMYILSGGLGGVGTEIAKHLLQHYHARLLLLGRTPLPDRHTWDECRANQSDKTAQRIEAYLSLTHGSGEVRYEAVDIADLEQLQTVVQRACADWQCDLDGVIHLAGRASEQSVLEETPATLAETLRPKVQGTWALHQLVKDQPERLFISFSSVNGFFGGNRAGAYAAANTFLDAFAAYQRAQTSIQSYCLAWSMWDEVGMSQGFQMKEFSRIQGYYSLSPQSGMQSLLGCLAHGQTQLLVGLDGSKRNVQRYLEAPAISLQSLSAYVTAQAPVFEALAHLNVSDRFGTPAACAVQVLAEMPLTADGEIDREQLTLLGRRPTSESTQPKTELEQQLANLWQDILGISRVGSNESFFELGGSSLQAARLFAEIEKQFGKNLPLSTLFETQTIEQLAQLLTEDTESSLWSSIVPIQPKGSKPPLFCIHGAGGNILMYRQLIPYLDADQPVYGIQPQGLDGTETPIDRLQEMAEIYVQKMRELQPEGPYYLTGLSIGGAIAIEMAHILRSQGQEAALVALIDSLGPGYPKLMPVGKRLMALLPFAISLLPSKIMLRWKRLIQPKRRPVEPHPEQSTDLPVTTNADHHEVGLVDEQLDTDSVIDSGFKPKKSLSLHEWLEQLSLWIYKFTPWAFVVPIFYLDSGRSLPDKLRRIQEANVKAFLEYQPEFYVGQVILFRASKQPPGCYSDPTMGWGKVTGELKIYEVPGHHGEDLLYVEKSSQVIGLQLQLCLKQTQRLYEINNA